MEMKTVKFIVVYTVGDDEVRYALREVITSKERYGGLDGRQIDESTYAIETGDSTKIRIIKNTLRRAVVENTNNNISADDVINLYYSAHLVNYSCSRNDWDKIIECPVLENGEWK